VLLSKENLLSKALIQFNWVREEIMKKVLSFLGVILLVVLVLFYLVCRKPSAKKPPTSLKSAAGVETTEFQPHDSILFEARDLLPRSGYDVQIVRDDGREMIALRLSSDGNGIIPETVLWYNIGVLPCVKIRVNDLASTAVTHDEITDAAVIGRKYFLRIRRGKEMVRETAFQVSPRLLAPTLYAADSRGCPKSGFLIGEEDIWVVGRNFPEGSMVRLWAVPQKADWQEGDKLLDRSKQYDPDMPPLFELTGGSADFKKLLWPRGLTSLGSYDIVAEVVTYPFGFYRAHANAEVKDIVSYLSYSGFVVQRRQGVAEPLEFDIAGTVKSPFTFQDTFLTDENVFVGVDPCIQPAYVGQTADVYIVADKTDAQWTVDKSLTDMTAGGVVETLTVGGLCGNCWKVLAWPATLTEGKYDVVLDFNRDGLYTPGVDLIDGLDRVGFTVSNIRVDSISFNTGGSGAITIYDDSGAHANVTAPEYSASGLVMKPAAWVMGGSHQVQVTFKAVASVASTQIWAETGLGGLASSGAPVTVTFSAGTGTAGFSVNSPPPAVGKNEFTWDWKYKSGLTTVSMGSTGLHRLYTVMAYPIVTVAPWLTILDYACTWAAGETTGEGVCVAILNNGFAAHYTWDYDCHRLASDFVKLVCTQGIIGSMVRWGSQSGGAGDMDYQRTRAFDAVGPTHPYETQDWSWHQWSAALGKQRDASAASSLTGDWGVYEDYLFTHYLVVGNGWVANNPGQSIGCEAPAHRFFTAVPTEYSWRGPDR
jgi:hypothetical protein